MNKAIKVAEPIPQEAIPFTVDFINNQVLKCLEISPASASLIGSAGKKKEPSKDIDIAIEKTVVLLKSKGQDPFSYVLSKMKEISPEVKDMRYLGIISAAIPVLGEKGLTGKFTQLDLMLVDNIRMAEWFYYSPSYLQSKYKGVYRTTLLSIITSYVRRKYIKDFGNTHVTWYRYFLEPSGLYYGMQTILSEKTGKPTVKRRTISKKFISNEPCEILKEILGPSAMFRDAESFERLHKYIKSDKFPDIWQTKKILERAKNVYKEAKLPIPKELL